MLSPPPCSGTDRFAAIGIPQFHVTGTLDTTPIEESKAPAMRLCPFRESTNSVGYLVVLDGADHMAFSGRRQGRAPQVKSSKGHRVSVAPWQGTSIRLFRALVSCAG